MSTSSSPSTAVHDLTPNCRIPDSTEWVGEAPADGIMRGPSIRSKSPHSQRQSERLSRGLHCFGVCWSRRWPSLPAEESDGGSGAYHEDSDENARLE